MRSEVVLDDTYAHTHTLYEAEACWWEIVEKSASTG